MSEGQSPPPRLWIIRGSKGARKRKVREAGSSDLEGDGSQHGLVSSLVPAKPVAVRSYRSGIPKRVGV